MLKKKLKFTGIAKSTTMNGTNIKRSNIAAAWSVTHREALQSLERQVGYDIAIRLRSFGTRDIKRLIREDIQVDPVMLGYETQLTNITIDEKGNPVLYTAANHACVLDEITLENKIALLEAIERIM